MSKSNAPGGSPRPACDYSKSKARGDGHGRAIPGTGNIKKIRLPDVNKGFNLQVKKTPGKGLSGRFLVPPFSVLNAREGEWQHRKRQWIALGIESEIGRGETTTWGISPSGVDTKQSNKAYTEQGKRKIALTYQGANSLTDFMGNEMIQRECGTSIFDPVLCELMYKWFCSEGGQIIDPFAGGSVRGIVATYMGYCYWGSELRPEQVEANKQQAAKIVPNMQPVWICGDARYALKEAPKADLIFSCPPYGNLEVYSDLEGDISNLIDYDEFLAAYRKIIKRACLRLKENRFACFVVANFRDKKTGFYHDFVGDTIRIFEDVEACLYNEIILVTAIGSLSIRVGRQFAASRKIGKTHQNVLVFYKGNPKKIKNNYI